LISEVSEVGHEASVEMLKELDDGEEIGRPILLRGSRKAALVIRSGWADRQRARRPRLIDRMRLALCDRAPVRRGDAQSRLDGAKRGF